MSDPRAMAAKMTGVRPVDHRDVVGGGTPGLGLTGLDVAGALAMGGANRAETLAVLAKWVQDESAQQMLFYEVYDAVVGLAIMKKWRVPVGAKLLRKMTRLAIAEVLSAKTCPFCNGRSEVWMKGKGVPVVCPECLGSGRKEWTAKARYEAVDLDKRNWERTWGERYSRWLMPIVTGFERRGLAALRNGLDEI